MELIHSAASDFWNGAEIKSSSEVFVCITFSFLLSHIAPFEKCDMVRNVDGQKEHQIMNSLLCHVVYNAICRGSRKANGTLCNCLSQLFSLVLHFFAHLGVLSFSNMMCYQCVSSSATSFWMCIKMYLQLYLHLFVNWHDHILLFILKSMERTWRNTVTLFLQENLFQQQMKSKLMPNEKCYPFQLIMKINAKSLTAVGL